MSNIFYISLLKQDITRKKRVIPNQKSKITFNNDKKFKVKIIYKSIIYVNEMMDKLLG